MSVDSISIDAGQMSASDELSGAPPLYLNMLVQGLPDRPRAARVRPGIRPWSGFPSAATSASPVVAITELDGRIIYVTDDGGGTRRVYGINGTSFVDMSLGGGTSTVDGYGDVMLVPWRENAFACGNGFPQKISRGFVSSRLAGSPPQARDLCIVAQRLILVRDDDSGVFMWADLGEGGTETWDSVLEFAEAEARPDILVGCKESAREVFMFGSQTTQVYQPDESTVFSTRSTLEVGCINRRSVMRVDQLMAWADNHSRLVISSGSSVEAMSDRGLSSTLKAMGTNFADVWGFRAAIGGHDLLAWSFPTDGRTFAWDRVSQTWSEWRRMDASTQRWEPWAPSAYYYSETLGKHLVGMPDGTVQELSVDATSDAGDPIPWMIRTGFKQVAARRHATEARFPARGSGAVRVAWRDAPGAEAEYEDVTADDGQIAVCPVGQPYRQRQYEISSVASAVSLVATGRETFEEAEF